MQLFICLNTMLGSPSSNGFVYSLPFASVYVTLYVDACSIRPRAGKKHGMRKKRKRRKKKNRKEKEGRMKKRPGRMKKGKKKMTEKKARKDGKKAKKDGKK